MERSAPNASSKEAPAAKGPRVFISYSWDSDEHKRWVEDLAAALLRDGVRARLDKWHYQKTQTVAGFMTSEVEDADDVVVICTPNLRARSAASDRGLQSTAVGWELGLLATLALLGEARKGVPVLAPGATQESIPASLLGNPFFDLGMADLEEKAAAYKGLLRRLMEGPSSQAPALGTPPILERTPSRRDELFLRPGGAGAREIQPARPARPPHIFSFRADRSDHYQRFRERLDETPQRMLQGSSVLFCVFRGAMPERPDKLLDCLREFLLDAYLEETQRQPSKELSVEWPRSGSNRLETLRRNLLREISTHVSDRATLPVTSISDGIRRIGAPILVRARAMLGRVEGSEQLLLEGWIDLWARLSAELAGSASLKQNAAHPPFVVVLTSFEHPPGFGEGLLGMLGGARKLNQFIDPPEGDADPPPEGDGGPPVVRSIERLPALRSVPVGELSSWLEHVVRPWIKEGYEPDTAAQLEDEIRTDLIAFYKFDESPERTVPMDDLAKKLEKILGQRISK
jgi:hypothetical protein